MLVRVVAALGVAVLATGCSGGSADEPAGAVVAPAEGAPAPDAGQALLAFVRAARERDARAMWDALSVEARAGAGGTPARFRDDLAVQLGDQLERFDVERVVLARRIGEHGVVALAGRRPPEEDEEPEDYAWAAVLVEEEGEWRVDLGGVAIERLRPAPLEEVDGLPELGARAAAAGRVERIQLWVDGAPVGGTVTRELPFVAEIEAEPGEPLRTGIHHAVAFAAGGGAAGAVAWPFEVN